MTDLIYDYITQAVDLIIAAAVLSSIIILLRTAIVLGNVSANQTANSNRLSYYKEYSKYDCKDSLNCADALSAIVYYRDTITVVYYPTTATNYTIYNDPNKDGKFFINDNGAITEINYETLKRECTRYADHHYKGLLYEDLSSDASTGGYQGGVITGIKIYE